MIKLKHKLKNLSKESLVQLVQKISLLEEKGYTVYFCDEHPFRSLAQNRYLWGVVYATISKKLGFHPEVLHEYFKKKFGLITKFSITQGEYKPPEDRAETFMLDGDVCEHCQAECLSNGKGDFICTNDDVCGINYSIDKESGEFNMTYNPIDVEEIVKSTKFFSKFQMVEFIDKIIEFAATEMDIQIPAPGELTEEQYITAIDIKL